MDGGLVTFGWIVGSIASSTSIIMMNKYVMDYYHFTSPTFLTAYHFIMTFGLLELMCRLNLFKRAIGFPQIPRLVLAAATVGAVVFMNFNLKLNSVGFYQLSKLLVIPAIVVYDFVAHGKRTPLNRLLSLGILLLGIGLFTISDVQVNLTGSAIAAVAVGCAAVSQTKTGSVQKEFGLNGPNAQHATALYQFVMTLLAALVVETRGLFAHSFATVEVVIVVLTGFVSLFVNVCAFGLIGKTSAITYQVVGHCKTILIFTFGLIMFPARHEETAAQFARKIAGLVVSMTGMIYYSYLSIKGSTPQPIKADSEKLLTADDEPNHGVSSKL
jgi:solute carrier family 35 protein E3